jgi:hypothetical protein
LKYWGNKIAFIYYKKDLTDNILSLQKNGDEYFIVKINNLPGAIENFYFMNGYLVIETSDSRYIGKAIKKKLENRYGLFFDFFEKVNNVFIAINKKNKADILAEKKEKWNRSTNSKHFVLFPYESAFNGLQEQAYFESFRDGFLKKVKLFQKGEPVDKSLCIPFYGTNEIFRCSGTSEFSSTYMVTFEIHRKDDYSHKVIGDKSYIELKIKKTDDALAFESNQINQINELPTRLNLVLKYNEYYNIQIDFFNLSSSDISSNISTNDFYWGIYDYNKPQNQMNFESDFLPFDSSFCICDNQIKWGGGDARPFSITLCHKKPSFNYLYEIDDQIKKKLYYNISDVSDIFLLIKFKKPPHDTPYCNIITGKFMFKEHNEIRSLTNKIYYLKLQLINKVLSKMKFGPEKITIEINYEIQFSFFLFLEGASDLNIDEFKYEGASYLNIYQLEKLSLNIRKITKSQPLVITLEGYILDKSFLLLYSDENLCAFGKINKKNNNFLSIVNNYDESPNINRIDVYNPISVYNEGGERIFYKRTQIMVFDWDISNEYKKKFIITKITWNRWSDAEEFDFKADFSVNVYFPVWFKVTMDSNIIPSVIRFYENNELKFIGIISSDTPVTSGNKPVKLLIQPINNDSFIIANIWIGINRIRCFNRFSPDDDLGFWSDLTITQNAFLGGSARGDDVWPLLDAKAIEYKHYYSNHFNKE